MDKYYKIKDSRIDFKGEKYFRVPESRDYVLQICVNSPTKRLTRHDLTGIYKIKFVSFTSNYFFPTKEYNYVIRCSKSLFRKKTKELLKKLNI